MLARPKLTWKLGLCFCSLCFYVTTAIWRPTAFLNIL